MLACRKILQISSMAYIFQRPFLRGLFLEGFIHGGKFVFQNRLGSPYSWKEIYRFGLVLLCIWGQFSKYKALGGLYLEGRFNGGFFALPVWGAYIWRGLYMEGLIFGILREFDSQFTLSLTPNSWIIKARRQRKLRNNLD